MSPETREEKSPRRVMHFLESGGLYGAESVVLNLSREMLKTSDYVPVVACIVQHPSEQVEIYDKALSYGIESHKIVVNNWRFLFDIPRFLFRLRRLKVDLIHSHGYKASIIGFFALVFLRLPLLPTCHLWFWRKDCSLKYRMMTTIEIFLYKFVKVITVVSLPIKQTLIRKGIRPERIKVIKNGINLSDFAPISDETRRQLREELDLLLDVPVIMNVGRLTEQKAQINLIRATQIMKNKGKKIVVLIIGDGELKAELEQKIKEYGVEEEVRLLGFRDDAKALLQIADVFLLCSLDEGLPMALLEAMASRIPVVATRVGDVPVLLDGDCGLIIPANDTLSIVESIEILISHFDNKAELINKGYNKIDDGYSSQKMYCAYSSLYRSLRES